MPAVYVAFSATQQEWGSDVGISKDLYKVGVADGTGDCSGADGGGTACDRTQHQVEENGVGAEYSGEGFHGVGSGVDSIVRQRI